MWGDWKLEGNYSKCVLCLKRNAGVSKKMLFKEKSRVILSRKRTRTKLQSKVKSCKDEIVDLKLCSQCYGD